MKEKHALLKGIMGFALCCTAFIYYGCKKEYNVIDTSGQRTTTTEDWMSNPNASSSLVWLKNNLKRNPNQQTVSLPSSGSVKVAFPDGLKVDFFAPFTFEDGSTASGSATATGILLSKKSDFVFNSRPTRTEDQTLVSGGSFKVTLSQNGKKINANYAITLDQDNDNYDIFDEAEGRDGDNVWVRRDSATAWRTIDSSINNGKKWCCFKKQKWINCDYFLRIPGVNLVKCFVKTNILGNSNCQVFCIFKNRNSVVSFWGNHNTKQFEIPQGYKGVPEGEEVILVAIGGDSKKGKYYFGFEDTKIQKDKTYSLNLTEMSESALKTALKQFD